MTVLIERLLKLDRKLLLLVVACLTGFLLLEAWLLAFRQPLADLAQLKAENTKLAQLSIQGNDLFTHITRLSTEIEGLNEGLFGQKTAISPQQQALQLVTTLDRLGSAQQVEIIAIKPGIAPLSSDFQKVELQVEAAGEYLHLAQWMQSLQALNPPIIFEKIQIRTSSGGGKPHLDMRLISLIPVTP